MSSKRSLYFTSLEQLQTWCDCQADELPLYDKLRISRESIEAYHRSDNNVGQQGKAMRLQIIHDYENGYQFEEDDNPMGYFPSSNADYYYLQFPNLCDEFIYFSHHRISIPPISWINQCHKSGITCLGTIIFEGSESKDFDELDKLMDKDDDGIHYKYIKMLSQLCKHYKFDGFLINVETRFSQADLGLQLSNFVACLQAELKLINPYGKIVWYDSYISNSNKINYGNGITDENYEFMKASDSMLTNYWWTEEHLAKNLELCGSKMNLFVGVDVWGRGMKYGNGGFESSIAISKLSEYNQSCGLFAPAWTYEYFGATDFEQNDLRFWLSAEPNSIADLVKRHNSTVYVPFVNQFIFYTTFSQGKGYKYFANGELLMNDTWINGSLTFEIPQIYFEQKIKPQHAAADDADDELKFELYYKDAYHLGTSLKITKIVEVEELSLSNYLIKRQNEKKYIKELFKFDQEFKHDLNLKMSYKYISSTLTNFQMVISYYVQRTVKSTHKVRDGVFKIPIYNNGNKWVRIDETFKMPKHSKNEKLILKSVAIEFVEIPEEDSIVLDDIIDKDWVIVEQSKSQRRGTNNVFKKMTLLIGDVSISSLEEQQQQQKQQAKKISSLQHSTTHDNETMLNWDYNVTDDSIISPLYWNIFIDDKFESTSVVPYFIMTKPFKKVRIDIINRDGECMMGDSITI